MIDTLAVVGVGLLGGSVAKAARAGHLAHRIVGIGRDAGRLAPARADGTLDEVTTDLAAGVRGADFVLLATPVLSIEALLPSVWRAAADEATLTDVGSTKAAIARAAERLAAARPLAFVGSHPMAGSERAGYAVARADLLHGATVIVTPTEATAPPALKTVAGFWEALGARVGTLDPETHDLTVAAISHLPHLVADALVDAVASGAPEALAFAARGFKDTTRIAAADPDMWADIFHANRAALGTSLAAFREALDALARTVASGSREEIRARLARIKAAREALR